MTDLSRVGSFTYHGTWNIRVVQKISDWPQRIIIEGAVNLVIDAVLGVSRKISGDTWRLRIEHNAGGLWRPNTLFVPGPLVTRRGVKKQTIFSKDRYWPGDATPNDLVVELRPAGTGMTVFRWRAVKKDLTPCKDGLRGPEPRYLAVDLRNTGHRPFDYDTLLNITTAGRNALADHGVHILDTWSDQDRRRVRQEVHGGAVSVPPIPTGEHATAHFLIDASSSRAGQPEVEFELLNAEDLSDYGPSGHRASLPVEVGDAAPTIASISERHGLGVSTGRLTAAPADPTWVSPEVISPSGQARIGRLS
ncbi:hypothetical protein [Micromonospora sp. NPDC050200]|uniref:hypothetical protein n=1 Tax=Micromonospora sp. NPDC050200 TaxID=3155664 RepID=UPI0033ED909F